MPSISWTNYSFISPRHPLTREAWEALRATTGTDHMRIIDQMRGGRSEHFWKDHSDVKVWGWVFGVGLFLMAVADNGGILRGLGALGVMCSIIYGISLSLSALSHSRATTQLCKYFREEFARASVCATYEDYVARR